MRHVFVLMTGLFWVFGLVNPEQVLAQKIYWGDANTLTIERSDLDGLNREAIISDPDTTGAVGIAFDFTNRRMYVVDYFGGSIYRANFGGSNLETIVMQGDLPRNRPSAPYGIAVDPGSEHLYFSDLEGIARVNFDGTGYAEILDNITASVRVVEEIAIDLNGDKLYFITQGMPPSVNGVARVNLDGTGFQQLVIHDEDAAGIAVDSVHGKVYWTTMTAPREIRRANLDGTAIERLAVASDAYSVDVDPSAGSVYYCLRTKEIWRADLDLSNPVRILANVGGSGLALDTTFTCALDLDLTFSSGTLTMDFQLGTQTPASWNVYGSFANLVWPLWSFDLPQLNPPVPVAIPVPIPRLGNVGILTTMNDLESVPSHSAQNAGAVMT